MRGRSGRAARERLAWRREEARLARSLRAGRLSRALNRGLFWLGWGLAGLLVALVLLAPLCDRPEGAASPHRLLVLFARDLTVRRTCLAGAVGLAVSACVFFPPSGWRRPGFGGPDVPRPRPPSSGMAGA